MDVGDEPIVPTVPIVTSSDGDSGRSSAGESAAQAEATPPVSVVELVPAGAGDGRVRRGRRVPLLVALAVVTVGGLGAAALLGAGDEPDPHETLAAAQAAVEGSTSFRFTMSGETAMRLGDDENGTDTTTRFTGTGAWADERWQMRSGGGFAEMEIVVDGTTTYERFTEPGGALEDELWQSWDTELLSRDEALSELASLSEDDEDDEADIFGDAGFRDTMAIALAGATYLGSTDGLGAAVAGPLGAGTSTIDSGFMLDPSGFVEAVQRLGEPTLVGTDGGVTTLAITLEAPADLVEAFGGPLPAGEVELDVGADDLPTALRLDVAAGESSSSIEIEISAWNEPVEITIPSGDEVDATPGFDEESLRDLEELVPVAPTDVPDGWTFTVFGPEETADMEVTGGDCEAIELDWDAMTDEGDYFWVVERPLDCALAADPRPFEPGGPGGLPSRSGAEFGEVEVQVGDTAVEVDSTLDAAERDAIIASLAATDVETLISTIPPELGG